MPITAAKSTAHHTVFLTSMDTAFLRSANATFSADPEIRLATIEAPLERVEAQLEANLFSAIIVDIDAANTESLDALRRLAQRAADHVPIIAVTQQFDQEAARTLLQLRIRDFLVKPVKASDLLRTCKRAFVDHTNADTGEAEIYTFLPSAGGVGVSTLAIQTAFMLHARPTPSGRRPETCIVDLDFQHGAIADYLDLEPRLDLTEVEPRPERLDRQLLEVMLSRHESGVAVIAAPNRPAEMRSFDPEVVTRLLDLASAYFDIVVIDTPRTWFSWTDSVLVGSNRLFIVCETTVPGLRHTQRLIRVIRERLGERARPEVVVNRFEQRMFENGLRRSDLEETLGATFAGTISNNYRLVREAIDRGVPLNEVAPESNVASDLGRIILPEDKAATAGATSRKPLLSFGRNLFARARPA
ncbi:MAG: response regulator receiver protein [Hyphomicrobiales bacterium]|nr:MAG: response regulator receiver protein [Hyphomicrobiales bacterium]